MSEQEVMELVKTCADVAQLLLLLPARSPQKERTSHAMQAALLATEEYLARFERGEGRDRLRERTLASIWRRAGQAITPISKEMANRFFMKENYWSFPELWSDEDTNRVGIGLSQVRQQIVAMISPI